VCECVSVPSNEGHLSIGLEKTFLDFVDNNDEQKQFGLEGKSVFNLNGGQRIEKLTAYTKDIGAQSELRISTIFASACYPYKTKLGTSVCIDTDIFGQKIGNKVCQVKDLQFSQGQGGPVTITKVEIRMLPDADDDPNKVLPQFIIHVENQGNGEVIIPELEKIKNACTSKSLTHKDFNRIKVSASLSNQPLDCNVKESGSNFQIILREKKDIARCILKEGIPSNRDAYIAPLSITLDYGYTLTISKDITIEKILKY